MNMYALRSLPAVLVAVALGAHAAADTLDTGDGLAVTFSEVDGSVSEVLVDGAAVPLVPNEPGGLSLKIGSPIPPAELVWLAFATDGGPWTSARNADWEDAGAYVTWMPDGGVDSSAHLLLGDGVTTGAGMAMDGPVPVQGGATLRISWQARSASIETTQILCVRIFDADGNDITSSVPAPPGWGWTSTSQAHGIWGLHCEAPDTWEEFSKVYPIPPEVAAIRVSLRHWIDGDHWLHLDDLRIDATGGIGWAERIPVLGPISPITDGFVQSVELPGHNLYLQTTVTALSGYLKIDVSLQDLSDPLTDRPIQLYWILPVASEGWQWWDDLHTSREIAADTCVSNTFDLASHDVSLYPFCSITAATFGLSLAVPMDQPTVQRFECAADTGLRSLWEIGLSPLTVNIGPGQAAISLVLFHHDSDWGFRAATHKYHALFPEYFVKRTTREGAWMYPIHPSQIPEPNDFGFAYHETSPLDEAEREVCAQHGIGIFYYTEPWIAWQTWGNVPERPPYEERVALLESWAADEGTLVTWLPNGGIDDSGHLLLGDGFMLGAGMATTEPFAVAAADTVEITWQAQVANIETTQILSVRLFDESGSDITEGTPAPGGWFWSPVSQAHVVAGIANTAPDIWEPFSYTYALAPEATAMRLSLRHWNGGDHFVHIDDLRVESVNEPTTYLLMSFEADDGSWFSAQNADWDNPTPIWLRAPRQQTAQAVINSSPLDAEGRYLIDSSWYLWHEWAPDSWNQAWPLNPDPDLTSPNSFELHRDYWIRHRLDETDGVYIDSVTAFDGVGGWENRRAEHLALSDSPLTFSWADGGPAQLAPQAQAELLEPIASEIRSGGRVMMFNLFPPAMRFHAHNADVMGSEVTQLVESDALSRIRRTLAGHRIVSNLLQWGWDLPTYITYEEMEEFIRGQLFWGFYPAVSSAGGPMNGGAPDRYFLHPELYERDRPLFQLYIPVVRALSSAGWEPITNATAIPMADTERFGDFSRGAVLLTVRGPEGAALEAEVTLDLTACGLSNECWPLETREIVTDQPLAIELLSDPVRARFSASLEAGEVGVYEFAPNPFPPGDIDGDGDVDLSDFALLLFCLEGPDQTYVPDHDCLLGDLDMDSDVDLVDFGEFQTLFTGGG